MSFQVIECEQGSPEWHRARAGVITAIPLRDREMNERHFEVQSLAGRQLPDAARAFINHLRAGLASEV